LAMQDSLLAGLCAVSGPFWELRAGQAFPGDSSAGRLIRN
jgi:hypothetical protein